jgi:hypothetical protein
MKSVLNCTSYQGCVACFVIEDQVNSFDASSNNGAFGSLDYAFTSTASVCWLSFLI